MDNIVDLTADDDDVIPGQRPAPTREYPLLLEFFRRDPSTGLHQTLHSIAGKSTRTRAMLSERLQRLRDAVSHQAQGKTKKAGSAGKSAISSGKVRPPDGFVRPPPMKDRGTIVRNPAPTQLQQSKSTSTPNNGYTSQFRSPKAHRLAQTGDQLGETPPASAAHQKQKAITIRSEQKIVAIPSEHKGTTKQSEQKCASKPPEQKGTSKQPEQKGATKRSEHKSIAKQSEPDGVTKKSEQKGSTKQSEQKGATKRPEQKAVAKRSERKGTIKQSEQKVVLKLHKFKHGTHAASDGRGAITPLKSTETSGPPQPQSTATKRKVDVNHSSAKRLKLDTGRTPDRSSISRDPENRSAPESGLVTSQRASPATKSRVPNPDTKISEVPVQSIVPSGTYTPSMLSPSAEGGSSSTEEHMNAPATPVTYPEEVQAAIAVDDMDTAIPKSYPKSDKETSMIRSPAALPKATTLPNNVPTRTSFDVRAALADVVEDFVRDQDGLVRASLSRARAGTAHADDVPHTIFNTRGRTRTQVNGMNGFQQASPFKSIQPMTTDDLTEGSCHELSLTIECAEPGGRKLKAQKRKTITATSWEDATAPVPSYTHCTHTRFNTAAHNEKVLHFFPYLGDEVEETVYGVIEEKYYMNISQRQKMVRQSQQSTRTHAYATEFLKDIGIDEADVLYFLLTDLKGWLDPLVQTQMSSRLHDADIVQARWQNALSQLAQRNHQFGQIEVAAWACAAWFDEFGFSLWQLVRKHHFEDALRAKKSTIDKIQALACRVCHQHDCPYHIDYAENDDPDVVHEMHTEYKGREGYGQALSSSEANDMDWPLQCNFRRRVNVAENLDNRPDSRDGISVNRPHSSGGYEEILKEVKNDVLSGHGTAESDRFYPCHHPGYACADREANCPCFRNDTLCEKACRCPDACMRRFRGCSCHAKGRKVCFDNDRCICFALKRECDADLCKHCGAEQVLDPANRDELNDKCRNVNAQLGLPKRTILGQSSIHGFGVYAGESIAKDEFIGEYAGEIILPGERARRGEVYYIRKMSYLFMLTNDQDIDSNIVGNKMRFVNHARSKGNDGACNIVPRIVMCNMTPRILMFAVRKIEVGEELFFDYGSGYESLIKDDSPDKKGRYKKEKATRGLRQTKEKLLAEPIYIPDPTPRGNRKVVRPLWSSKGKSRFTEDGLPRNDKEHARKSAPTGIERQKPPQDEDAEEEEAIDSESDHQPGRLANLAGMGKEEVPSSDESESESYSDEDLYGLSGRKRQRQASIDDGSDETSDFEPDTTDFEAVPRRTGRARKRRKFDDEPSEDDGDDAEPMPVKRGPGRPRKHPLP